MDRTQFTFYESFYRAVSRIKKKADRAEAYDAICAYALYGIEPDMDSLSDSAAIAFELSKPNLDASRRKASSGKKGGEHKQSESKPEAKPKQTESKPKQTASKKEKENKKEIENKCYNPLTPEQESLFSPELLEAVKLWLTHKHERKEDYKPTGLNAMLSEIKNNAAAHGDRAVIDLIRQCMSQNWKGIIWEKLSAPKTQAVSVKDLGDDLRKAAARSEMQANFQKMRAHVQKIREAEGD